MEAQTETPMTQGVTHTVHSSPSMEGLQSTNRLEQQIQTQPLEGEISEIKDTKKAADELLHQAKEEGPSHTLELLAVGKTRAQREDSTKDLDSLTQHELPRANNNDPVEQKMKTEKRDEATSEESDDIHDRKVFQDFWNEVI